MADGWTQEQIANASAYGICDRCGGPREAGYREADPAMVGLVCPSCPDLYDGPAIYGSGEEDECQS